MFTTWFSTFNQNVGFKVEFIRDCSDSPENHEFLTIENVANNNIKIIKIFSLQ